MGFAPRSVASAASPELPGPSASLSIPILLPMPALRRARDIFFPEPRPFKGLPGRDPYASVFSTAPQLMERYNKREQLYGRFIVPLTKTNDPDPRNKVDVKLLRMHFDNFPSRLSGRPTPAPPTQTQAAQPPNNKKRKTVGATKKEEEGQDGGGEHDKENPEEELDKPQKRKRRLAKEINRKFACPFPRCDKAYGTQGALDQHMRKKHADARLHMPALQPILQNPLHPMPFVPHTSATNAAAAPSSVTGSLATPAPSPSPSLSPSTSSSFSSSSSSFLSSSSPTSPFPSTPTPPRYNFSPLPSPFTSAAAATSSSPVTMQPDQSSTLGTGNSAKAPAGLVGKFALPTTADSTSATSSPSPSPTPSSSLSSSASSSSSLPAPISSGPPGAPLGAAPPAVGTQQQQQQLPPPPEPLPPPPPLLATPPAITNTTSTIVQGDPMYLDRQ